jgi:hypothetical protein
MAEPQDIDLAYRLLDLDVIDAEGRRCGKVDDIELIGEPGENTYVNAIRTGPGALPQRFNPRLRRLARRIFKGSFTRISEEAIDDFAAAVELNQSARELGLGAGDRRLAELFGGQRQGGPE